jgi:hypothetical protein
MATGKGRGNWKILVRLLRHVISMLHCGGLRQLGGVVVVGTGFCRDKRTGSFSASPWTCVGVSAVVL